MEVIIKRGKFDCFKIKTWRLIISYFSHYPTSVVDLFVDFG